MKCRNCQPHVETEFLSRRDFLSRSGAGFGLLGLAGVLSQEVAVEGRVSVNDLHATILQLMGLDHEHLIYSHNGRPFRLTDVAGRLIHPILA